MNHESLISKMVDVTHFKKTKQTPFDIDLMVWIVWLQTKSNEVFSVHFSQTRIFTVINGTISQWHRKLSWFQPKLNSFCSKFENPSRRFQLFWFNNPNLIIINGYIVQEVFHYSNQFKRYFWSKNNKLSK